MENSNPSQPDTLLLGPWLPPSHRQRILQRLIQKLAERGRWRPSVSAPGKAGRVPRHPVLRKSEEEEPLRLEWTFVPRFIGAKEF